MKIFTRPPGVTVASEKRPPGEAVGRTDAAAEKLELVAGQIVKGRVVGSKGEGKVLLAIGDRTVSARSLVPLAKGSEVLLEVKEAGAMPWLTLAGKKGLAQEVMRLLLGEAPGLARVAGFLSGAGVDAAPVATATGAKTAVSPPGQQASQVLASASAPSVPAGPEALSVVGPSGASGVVSPSSVSPGSLSSSFPPASAVVTGSPEPSPGAVAETPSGSGAVPAAAGVAVSPASVAAKPSPVSPAVPSAAPMAGGAVLPPPLALPSLSTELFSLLESLRQEVGGVAMDGQAEVGRLVRMLRLFQGAAPARNGEVPVAIAGRLAEVAERLGEAAGRVVGGGERSAGGDLDKMARLLDGLQQLNSHPSSPNQPVFLLLPCFLAGGAGWGQWLFSMAGEGGAAGEDRGCAIDFFLQMSRLGDLHLRLFVKGNALSGEFSVADEQVRSHLAAQLAQLAAVFEGYGYQPVSFSCRLAVEPLPQTVKRTVEQKAQLRSFALVDISA